MTLSRRTLMTTALAAPAGAAFAQPDSRVLIVGSMAVEPLLDGPFPLTLDLIPDANNAEGMALLAAAGLPAAGPDTLPVNAFVVRQAGRVTLIDGGAGGLFGPALGKMPERLAAANVGATQVEAILLTHLHADHVGGLVLPNGSARFPNAELVLQAGEAAFWTDDGNRSRAPTGNDAFFVAARAALNAYQGRLRLVSGAESLAPGMTAVPLPGHTPGHAGVLLEDGNERLLIWGDIIHSAALQLPRPEWAVVYDVDPALAAATRARVLEMAAADGVRVAGMHLATQGLIERRGAGYALVK